MCSIQYDNAWGQQGKMEQKDRVQIEMQCNVTAAPVRKTNIRHLEHKNWPCPAGAEVSNIKHVSKKTLWMPKLRNQKARQEGCVARIQDVPEACVQFAYSPHVCVGFSGSKHRQLLCECEYEPLSILWQAGDLSTVYPVSCPMKPPCDQ